MNIVQKYMEIPKVEHLLRLLLTYSKIDQIMLPEAEDEYLKVYHYDKEWLKDGHFFKIDNNSGNHYYILFIPSGCIIKGFDHESELSPYNLDEENDIHTKYDFYRGAPADLLELLDDDALEKDDVTFCTWHVTLGDNWQHAPLNLTENCYDGINNFLFYLPTLEKYVEWFEDNYEIDLDPNILQKIYDGVEITAEISEAMRKDYEA